MNLGVKHGLTENSSPGGPSDDGVLVLVTGVLEDAEEYEASRHGGVQDSEEEQGGDHERERHLLVNWLQRSEGRGGHVLVSGVGVYDSADNGEDEDLGNCACPKSLGEVPNQKLSVLQYQRRALRWERKELTWDPSSLR